MLIDVQMHFQVMGDGALEADNTGIISGELEIEKLQTRNIESRSKNLIPVFESLHTSRFQQSRYAMHFYLAIDTLGINSIM